LSPASPVRTAIAGLVGTDDRLHGGVNFLVCDDQIDHALGLEPWLLAQCDERRPRFRIVDKVLVPRTKSLAASPPFDFAGNRERRQADGGQGLFGAVNLRYADNCPDHFHVVVPFTAP
jgi:hypothetical protein